MAGRIIALKVNAKVFEFQISQMRNGVDVICATPGRLNDLLERGCIVSYVILCI